MKRVALHTLGCKLNFAETSAIGKQFTDLGFHIVDSREPADVYVLNTCSVTERADREARQIIRRFVRMSPDAFVVVTGCYAQLEPEEIASIDGVDAVLGSKEKFRLVEHVGDFQKSSYPRIFVSDIHTVDDFGPAFSADVGGRTRAFLKVQDGCDYSCAFCTIPLARGGSRSLPIEAVVEQARRIARLNYREIVLTGVNVGDYGKKLGTNLFHLLRELEKVEGIDRIRVSSIEPNLLTEEMIDFIVQSEKLCNHFHLPLQSGSDTILKKMRRRYLSDDYRALVEFIREHDPDAGIGADVIVGFPGETDQLFEETSRFLADLPISYLHVFTYSERPNTPAASFEGMVESKERFKRSELLRTMSLKKRRAFQSKFIGTSVDVLVEANSQGPPRSGLTTNYVRVAVDVDASYVNRIVPVLVRDHDGDGCWGVVTESASRVVPGNPGPFQECSIPLCNAAT